MGSAVMILLCQRLRGIGIQNQRRCWVHLQRTRGAQFTQGALNHRSNGCRFFRAKRQHHDLSGLKNGLDAHGQSRVWLKFTRRKKALIGLDSL